MSALDQAFIKAYAKDQLAPGESARADRPVTTWPGGAAVSSALPAAEARGPAQSRGAGMHPTAATIEQLYHDGSLYRIEAPRAATPGAGAVPPPHLLPPRTSPRRGVRRSMLKLWADQSAAQSGLQGPAATQRVARKVIIRHVSHSAAPPPNHRAELPPETIFDEPPPVGPLPAAPLDPQSPLLNQGRDLAPSIAVQEFWQAGAEIPAPVVLAEALLPPQEAADDVLVTARVDSLEARPPGGAVAPTGPAAEQKVAKNNDLRHEPGAPPAQFRLDPPHAKASHRPHLDFAPDSTSKTSQELGLAEPIDEPLASDRPADIVGQTAPLAAKPSTPLWEVDRFHWPRACETLLADKSGYFAHSQQKLLAAVQDGLRVLAITGSRRGEGRTTLALCLARSAAAAGIQVALMDIDFARPQIAARTGLDVAFGWQEAALGRIPLSEAAVKSVADKITILPLERSAASNWLSLADPRVTATIRAAAATFELLILDLGPLAPGEEIAFPPGEACPLDAAIIVRDMRFATEAESDVVGRKLQDAGLDAVGIAENFVVEEE